MGPSNAAPCKAGVVAPTTEAAGSGGDAVHRKGGAILRPPAAYGGPPQRRFPWLGAPAPEQREYSDGLHNTGPMQPKS